MKRECNTRHIANDYDLLFIFKDFHRQLYTKCRLVMQCLVVCGKLSYALSLHLNTNRVNSFKFTEEILYINLMLRQQSDFDYYDISYTSVYSKAIIKFVLFEEIFDELIALRWHPLTVYDFLKFFIIDIYPG